MMKLFSFYSDSHIPLLNAHFLPSVPFDMQMILMHMPQECPTGSYYSQGWSKTMAYKAKAIEHALQVETEPFFVVDADARFYGPFADDALACLNDADIAFQYEGAAAHPQNALCAGCYIARPSSRLAAAFARAWALIPRVGGDQLALGVVLARTPTIHTVRLPRRYWSQGRDSGAVWTPGQPVGPPTDLLVHHANWCVGVENKLALLEAVRLAHG